MIRAIIFDFDGLILDTEYPEYLSWSEVYEQFGLMLPIKEWAAIIGKGASTISRTPYDDLEERLGTSLDRPAIRQQRRSRFAELMTSETVLPGVVELINDAERHGVKLGIASSSAREWVHGYLEAFGLRERFPVTCCGDEVARAKPAPDLYLTALDSLQCTPTEAIALEDSPNGIATAKAAGMFCIAVPNALTRHTSLAAADYEVKSLLDVGVAKLQAILTKR